jgi:hypothetical protein
MTIGSNEHVSAAALNRVFAHSLGPNSYWKVYSVAREFQKPARAVLQFRYVADCAFTLVLYFSHLTSSKG